MSPPPRSPQWLRMVIAVVAVLISGVAIGAFLPQDGVRAVLTAWLAPPATPADDHDHTAPSGDIFDMTLSAQEALDLTKGPLRTDSFTSVVRVPAFVRERPAVSNLQAASRLQGSVAKIFVSVGQSVREGDPIIELQLTGDELAAAQSTLLDSIKQLEIIDADMPRLEQAARTGGPSVKTLRERKFERRRLQALVKVKQQELLVRGLTEEQVASIVDAGFLVRTVTIRVPTGIRPHEAEQPRADVRGTQLTPIETDRSAAADDWVYSIESLHVSPGSIVMEGQPLCELAYHETLLLEGQAYERDIPILTKLIDQRIPVTAEMGDDDAPLMIPDLQVLFMDNHVDNESQTYRFYAEIANHVVTDNQKPSGRRFRTWQLKPGQRGHIQLPSKEYVSKFVLPTAAVTKDGLDNVVFRWLDDHNPWHTGEPPHSEFERVVVKVLYQDRQTAVIDTTGELKVGDTIAMDNAYMLLLAMQGGGEDGGHDHHGHEH